MVKSMLIDNQTSTAFALLDFGLLDDAYMNNYYKIQIIFSEKDIIRNNDSSIVVTDKARVGLK